jgi:hypothetical protein
MRKLLLPLAWGVPGVRHVVPGARRGELRYWGLSPALESIARPDEGRGARRVPAQSRLRVSGLQMSKRMRVLSAAVTTESHSAS